SGSPHHLFMETIKTEQGLSIQHVPYKGTAGAIADLLSNGVQIMFCDATIALPNIQAGKVVALGTSAAKPTQLVANVPPIAATIPNFDWQAWQGIVAPAGTPKEVIALLSNELNKLLDNADFRAQLVKFGMEPYAPQTPEQFAAVIVAEQPRWIKAIRDSGAKVE
ncbi:MAG TPA: tripartite tricarboxylate transporter substrate-binding protein, partial [Casimicrobiaceae bacterium]|nr:tripartite tricarboxylate transporter substrate-binding protein [Casimicrobiaceae bacterium]